MQGLVLVSGQSNQELALKISEKLKTPLCDPQIIKFANGEFTCEIEKSVRGADVFVIQSLTAPVNDNLMEILVIIDALKRASAKSITAVTPHYCYSRQDRKVTPRSPISAKLVADLFMAAGANRLVTMDLHAGQIQGFFDIPFDNIYASPVFLEYIEKNIPLDNLVLVSPDVGGVERVRWYAKKLNKELALIDKRRTGPNIAKAFNLVGDVAGKDVLIIDDMIDTAGTLIEAVRAIKEFGAQKIYVLATHGLFSDPAYERIKADQNIEEIIISDTAPLHEKFNDLKKIKTLTTADVWAKSIECIYNNKSISDLFV